MQAAAHNHPSAQKDEKAHYLDIHVVEIKINK